MCEVVVLKKSQLEELIKEVSIFAASHILEKTYNQTPEVMTLAQVASYCSVSEPTIRKAIKEKGFPCTTALGDKRFIRSEVDRWLKGEERNDR